LPPIRGWSRITLAYLSHGSHRPNAWLERFHIPAIGRQFSLRAPKSPWPRSRPGIRGRQQSPSIRFTTPMGPNPSAMKSFSNRRGPRLIPLRSTCHSAPISTSKAPSPLATLADVRWSVPSVRLSADRCKALQSRPLSLLRFAFATAGYKPEELGLGAGLRLPKRFRLAGSASKTIAVFDLNEAFAAQSSPSSRGRTYPDRQPNGGRHRPAIPSAAPEPKTYRPSSTRTATPKAPLRHGHDVRRRRQWGLRGFLRIFRDYEDRGRLSRRCFLCRKAPEVPMSPTAPPNPRTPAAAFPIVSP